MIAVTMSALSPKASRSPTVCPIRRDPGGIRFFSFPDTPTISETEFPGYAVTGWQGRGEGVTEAFVSSLRIPLSDDTVFASILASGVPHFGPLEQVQWPPEMAEHLGAKAPDCAVFPIRILDGIAAFLYADRLGGAMHYEDFAIVARASAATANALSRFLLRRNSATPVS